LEHTSVSDSSAWHHVPLLLASQLNRNAHQSVTCVRSHSRNITSTLLNLHTKRAPV